MTILLPIMFLTAFAAGLYALTANRQVDRYVDQELRTLPVLGSTKIYGGSLVGLSGGYARPLVAGDAFGGIAYEYIDNSSGSSGDKVIRVYMLGDFEHALGSANVSYNGKAVYASDESTLTYTATGNSLVGFQVGKTTTGKIALRIQPTPVPLAGGTMTGNLVSAGITHKVTTKASAANVTISTTDLGGVIVVTGTAAGNLNLPAAATAGAGAWCTFLKTGASGALTVEPDGAETIQGAANNAEMDAAGDNMTIFCDGSAWYILSKTIG